MTVVRHEDTAVLSPAEQWTYAETVAPAQLLPKPYRDRPADIMIAIGLGQSMGLTPAEALYRIDVINGKPTASAELIAANVRKAGHKLRLRIDEQNTSATCTIIRADDPDFEHTVTRDAAWAKQMGLAGKDNYKTQPATMLGWRAVTACARVACPEALYGVAHTADEMLEHRPATAAPTGLAAALQAEQVPNDPPAPEQRAKPAETTTQATAEPMLNTKSRLARDLYSAISDAGIPKENVPDLFAEVTGRDVAHSEQLTEAEAQMILDYLPATEEAPNE